MATGASSSSTGEGGELVNPHNPDFITKRPWYLGDSGPSLTHQGHQKNQSVLSLNEADALSFRGLVQSSSSSTRTKNRKWKKGACSNCGATTHLLLECVERPRSTGAKYTNSDIQPDEIAVDVRSQKHGKLTFDAKRDQWMGYDPKEHVHTVRRYEKIENQRQANRIQQMNETTEAQDAEDAACSSDSDFDDEFQDKEGKMISKRVARQGGVGGAELKTTVRNLRIREDTAKYLRNLNPNSAYYDPKSRSMRDNPTPNTNPDELVYQGDNFIRQSGDVQQVLSTQIFAWEEGKKGNALHPQGAPSAVELLKKQFESKKKNLHESKKKKLIDAYGGQEHLNVPTKELLYSQSENYVEYSRDGRVVKGTERMTVKSKYVEDVLENNHTHIWGSWYDIHDQTWGFGCCHSKVRQSYCTGEAGKVAAVETTFDMAERVMLVPRTEEQVEASIAPTKTSDLYGVSDEKPELDADKLKKALKKQRRKDHTDYGVDERKRKYNSMGNSHEVDAEEMEAYRMTKRLVADPMANFMEKKK